MIAMAEVIESSTTIQITSNITTDILSRLPDHIIADILSRLPPRSIARLRSVCKHLRSLTCDPCFLTLQCKRAQPRMLNRFVNEIIMFFDEAEDKIIPKCSEIHLQLYFLSNSVNGLTCAYSVCGSEDFYLLNPTTRELVELPSPRFDEKPEEDLFFSVGIGFDAAVGTYKMVRLFSRQGIPCGGEVLTLGDQIWRFVEENPSLDLSCSDSTNCPVFLHGALHWIVVPRHGDEESLHPSCRILAFDIKNEKYGPLIPFPATSAFEEGVARDLKESRGHLHVGIYSIMRKQLEIWVLDDYASHGWTKRYNFHWDSFSGLGQHIPPDIGISNVKIMLYCQKNQHIPPESFLKLIIFYDNRNKTCRKLYFSGGRFSFRHVHMESLISPRELLSSLSAIRTA